MLRKDLIIHKTRMQLDEFLAPMLAQVDKPRKRFLRQTVRAYVLNVNRGSLCLASFCTTLAGIWLFARNEI